MTRTLGLNVMFDIMFQSDVSFRYVVENPKILRRAHVPEQYLGTNRDGSVRSQEQFRAYASEIRLWESRIWDYHEFEQRRADKNGNRKIPNASRLQLIREVAARRSSRRSLRTDLNKMVLPILFKARRLALIKERATALSFATA